MKTLYLCAAYLRPPGCDETERVVRLVWANDADHAERIMYAEYWRDSPRNITCTPALGTPTQEPA